MKLLSVTVIGYYLYWPSLFSPNRFYKLAFSPFVFLILFVGFCFVLFFFYIIDDMLSKRYLKFASFDVEGLRNKLDDINFKNAISKFHFITLVETWLPTDEQVNFEGYISFSLYRRKNPRAKRA